MHAIVVMEVQLTLKMKMKEERLSKAEDVVRIGPVWNLNGNHWVKSGNGQFQDVPQVVISII